MVDTESPRIGLQELVEMQTQKLLYESRSLVMALLRYGNFRACASAFLVGDRHALARLELEAKYLAGETADKPVFMPMSHEEGPLRTDIVAFVEEMKRSEIEFTEMLAEVAAGRADREYAEEAIRRVAELHAASHCAARLAVALEGAGNDE